MDNSLKNGQLSKDEFRLDKRDQFQGLIMQKTSRRPTRYESCYDHKRNRIDAQRTPASDAVPGKTTRNTNRERDND